MFLALLHAARPRQWIKNLLVYAGFLFTLGRQPVAPAFLRATLGVFLFCCLSASAYMVNDVRDVEQDRAHPEKRKRPIARGALPIGAAATAAALLAVVGFVGAFALGLPFALLALAYYLLTLAYSYRLKYVVLVDVIALAMGYVLRALAGAAVLAVPASFWLALCTLLLALFLGLCKRRSEVMRHAGMTPIREILREYTEPLLDQLISVVTASALLAYALYTYFTPTAPILTTTWGAPGPQWRFRDHLLTLTIPFVVYGIYRYLYLVYRRNLGGAPEMLFLEDRPLQWNTLLWVLACLFCVLLGPTLSPLLAQWLGPQPSR